MGCEHIFPKDWRNMSVERVLMHITDLQKNHKLYMVYHTDTNQISVGEDILITQYKDKYVINGLYSPELDKELKYLCDLCKGTASPTAKISHWCENNVRGFVQAMGYTAAVAAVVGLGFGVHSGIKKVKQNKEQYIQKRIDAAIQEYEASKTINYNDAVNQKTR